MTPDKVSDFDIVQKQKRLNMSDKLWHVYVHINKINQKRYVGITSKLRPEQRWEHGYGYNENTHFRAAIKKYGWDNFDHIVLCSGLQENSAKEMERFLISLWDTQNTNCGYNMTSGGDGTANYHPSEETRIKLSLAKQRNNLSDLTLQRRSAGLKGRKFSDEHRRKIGDANSKPVHMLTKDGLPVQMFVSTREAEKETGIGHSHISQCCHGSRNSAGGYRWQFVQ